MSVSEHMCVTECVSVVSERACVCVCECVSE